MAPVMSSGHEKNQWQFICDFFINISKAKICIFRAFDWPSTISGYKLWPKNDNYLILQNFPTGLFFEVIICWKGVALFSALWQDLTNIHHSNKSHHYDQLPYDPVGHCGLTC